MEVVETANNKGRELQKEMAVDRVENTHWRTVEGRRNCGLGGLKAQTISCLVTTRLSSMYAPIISLALVFVAFRCKEPDDLATELCLFCACATSGRSPQAPEKIWRPRRDLNPCYPVKGRCPDGVTRT